MPKLDVLFIWLFMAVGDGGSAGLGRSNGWMLVVEPKRVLLAFVVALRRAPLGRGSTSLVNAVDPVAEADRGS